jgi:hypothetical protein
MYITKEELVLTILEHQNGTGTEANSTAVSSNAVKKKSEKSNQHDNAPKIKQEWILFMYTVRVFIRSF